MLKHDQWHDQPVPAIACPCTLTCSGASISREKKAACSRRSISLQSSFFDPERKNSCMFEAEKSFNFAPKQPLRSRAKNSCMFEAENSLNFAPKQPLRSREKKTAACSRLKNRSISLQSSLFDPERKNSSCSRVKIAEFRSKAASSIQRETTAACSKLKFAQLRSKTTLFDPERNNSCMFEAENSLNFALKQRLRSREK